MFFCNNPSVIDVGISNNKPLRFKVTITRRAVINTEFNNEVWSFEHFANKILYQCYLPCVKKAIFQNPVCPFYVALESLEFWEIFL